MKMVKYINGRIDLFIIFDTRGLLQGWAPGRFFPVEKLRFFPVPVFPSSTGKYAGGCSVCPVPVEPENRVPIPGLLDCSTKS